MQAALVGAQEHRPVEARLPGEPWVPLTPEEQQRDVHDAAEAERAGYWADVETFPGELTDPFSD